MFVCMLSKRRTSLPKLYGRALILYWLKIAVRNELQLCLVREGVADSARHVNINDSGISRTLN